MPLVQPRLNRLPNTWQAFGHSYLNYNQGTRQDTGRADGLFRNALGIGYPNWQNWAINGARITQENRHIGGFPRVFQGIQPTTGVNSPYVQYGGGRLFCYGINDVGNLGDTTMTRNGWVHSNRTLISLSRASVYLDTNDASIAYGGTWATVTADPDYMKNSAGLRTAPATASPTITFTIPGSFTGGAISFLFSLTSGAATGGTVALSGTATPSTKTINGSLGGTSVGLRNVTAAGHSPAVIRISDLTAANSGQTIVLTVSSIDSGGLVGFDGIFIESVNPGPVLVCNMPHLPAAGYNLYTGVLSVNTLAVNDAIMDTWNGLLAGVVAEFDNMVQVVDLATPLDSTGTRAEVFAAAGLHLNELGAGMMAEACLKALDRIRPSTRFGVVAQMNTPGYPWGTQLQPRVTGNFYTAEHDGRGADYTAVVGDMFAIPIFEQAPQNSWTQWSMEATAGSGTAPQVITAIYDDPASSGYPRAQYFGPVTQTWAIGAGVKLSSAITQAFEPGLYWLVIKFTVIGTTNTWKTIKGPNPYMPRLATTGGILSTIAASGNGGHIGYKLTGQGTGALPGSFPLTGATLVGEAPMVGLKYG